MSGNCTAATSGATAATSAATATPGATAATSRPTTAAMPNKRLKWVAKNEQQTNDFPQILP